LSRLSQLNQGAGAACAAAVNRVANRKQANKCLGITIIRDRAGQMIKQWEIERPPLLQPPNEEREFPADVGLYV
jgi:hypothetical protein